MSNFNGIKLPDPSPEVARAIETCAELPLLDVGDYIAGKDGALEQLAANIRAIQSSLGFSAIVNHGVDQSFIDEAEQQVKEAFHLPQDELQKYFHGEHIQGYWPANSVTNVRPGYETEKEWKSTLAGWAVLRDREPNDPKVVQGIKHRAQNKWPDPALLPDFKAKINRYHNAMVDLAFKLLKAYSVALGQSPDFLDEDFADSEWYGRLNYYAGSPNAEGELANTAHSDHSFITLLPMSPIPGLQVRTPNMDWIDVECVPGAIIVNGGEWLNQLSNGRFMATPHRVTEPPTERVSMPLFFDPGDEAFNDPVPGMLAEGEERQYPRKNFYEHFAGYIDAYTTPKK